MLWRSICVAIVGRVFDGLATDNILHYTLAAIYIRTSEPDRFSRLMGTSLALYMIGMSMSPTLVTLLPNFFFSFILAIAILGLSLLYLVVFIPVATPRPTDGNGDSPGASPRSTSTNHISFFDPILHFYREPTVLLPGMAILLYNSAQAYLFPAIMVHAALKFGFTSTENGYIISIAAGTSSVYLFIVFYLLPKVYSTLRREKLEEPDEDGNAGHDPPNYNEEPLEVVHQPASDLLYAGISMTSQFIVLPRLALVSTSSELYVLVVFISLGLAVPSFIKSYAVTAAGVKDSALAGLAVMESVGGLASPIILGTSQSLLDQGGVFFIAFGLVGVAMLCLTTSLLFRR